MLFTPLKRPLDLKGTSELNRAVDERHFINSESDRIFVPQMGPFFKDSMIIVDVLSGNTLVEHEDYRLLHMVSTATDESNKEVVTVVYITNKTISEVLTTYQAIGGIYAEGSIALLEIIERFKNAKLPPIYWATILNLPDKFPVTPHRHTIYDLEGLEYLVSALTKVYDSIVGRDIPKFQTLYDNLDKVILDLDSRGSDYIQTLEQGFMRIESNLLYRKGNVKVTDNNQNPFDYLGYGSWVRLENVLLYGHTLGGSDDPITNISSEAGLVARKTNFWEQISDIEGVSFVLTASTSSVNEGQSVTYTLRTSGMTEGTLLPYKIDGVTQADIVQPLSGNFVINAQGMASVTITTVEDRLTEGAETMSLYLENYTSIRRGVRINDTSRSPNFSVYYTTDIEGKNSINQTDEGSTFYIFVQSEFVDDGQVINLFYTGSTTTNADFNTSLPAQLTISGGRAVAQVNVKADQLTEGNEILFTGVSLSSADAIIASNVLTIRDSSRTPGYNITYSVSDSDVRSISEISEGVDFWCIIETENVANGSVYGINNAGTVNNTDFDTLYPTSVVINNNTAKFKMRLSNDLRTEGAETLAISLMLNGSSVYNKTITVLDTSVNPDANMKFSTNSSGTNNITQANEGDVVYLIVTTQNTPNGTGFNLIYSGSADANDFTEGRPGSVVINDNRAVVRLGIKADQVTEGGDETLVVTLQNQFTRETLGTVTLTIKDTSKLSTFKLRFSTDVNGNGTINNADEGQVVYGVIETTDVDNGTVLFVDTTIGGKVATVANGDVTTNVPSSVTIQNNFAVVKISLNNDMTNEGAEALLMNVRDSGSNVLATATMTVNDTSKSPTYSCRLVQGAIGTQATVDSPNASMIMVNMFYAVLIQTTNVPDGTVLYVRRNDAVEPTTQPVPYLADAAFTLAPSLAPVGSVIVNNNKALVPFKISPSYITDTNKAFTLGLYLSASGGSPVTLMRTIFGNPSYSAWFSSNVGGTDRITAVNEGSDAYYIIETTNVPYGSRLNGQLYINDVTPGLAALNEDVYGAPYVAYNIDSGRVGIKYAIQADELKEGNEVFKIRLSPYVNVESETPWYKDTTITIVDTSYRAPKIRAWTTTNNAVVYGNAVETFDPNIYSSFVTPEGGHEGWSMAPAANLQSLDTQVFNRSGTSRIGYTGTNDIVVIDSRRGDGKFLKWQKSFHNEVTTDYIDVNGSATLGSNLNYPCFISPMGGHEGWTLTRGQTNNVLSVFNRSGTNRINYSGKVSITQMQKYLPHYGDHLGADFPRIVAAGISQNNDLIPLYDMFKYNITDTTKYAIMFTPEGGHEGWSLARAANGITPNVFNRSGTNRIGYAGQNSWALVQLKADSDIDNPKRTIFAKPGSYQFTLKKDKNYLIEVIGAGGAGGNAIYYHSGASMLKSEDGGPSSFEGSGAVIIGTGGGIGGIRGNWNNGSAYHDGPSGAGGTAYLSSYDTTPNFLNVISSSQVIGPAGWMSRYNAGAGGICTNCPEKNYFGQGGKGMYGSGDDNLGFGGSGGAGGYSSAIVKSLADKTYTVRVGKGGAPYNDPTEYYQSNWHYGFGVPGQDGMVVITEIGDVGTTTLVPEGGTVDNGYNVVRGFNLADEFIRKTGRNPMVGEIITLNVPSNWALIGNDASKPGITIDARLNGVTSITINNSGYIAGLGGNGAGGDYGGRRGLVPTEGNTGITNTSTINVIVYNTGLIGGGGGGMGCFGVSNQADTAHGGTGGVPYGYSNRSGAIGTVPLTDAAALGWTYKPTLLGVKGINGNMSSVSAAAREGKLAGYIKEGLVTINNINGGVTKGR